MKQSITVLISSVLTIGLLASPVAAKSTENNEGEVLNLHVKVEKSNILPSKYVFYKYIINKKGDSPSNLQKLLNHYKLDLKNVEIAKVVKKESKQETTKELNEPKSKNNTQEQKEVKNKEVSNTSKKSQPKVVEAKKEEKPVASQESNKEPVQTPVEEKTTENVQVNEQPTVNTQKPVVNTQQPVEQEKVQEQVTQPVIEKEQPQVNNSVMLQVVDLTNKEREKAGLAPLQVDSALMANAQEKSQDMQSNNYFSHQSPTLGSPFDQMKSRGITYKAAGENIAQGQTTAEQVVQAWMDSPGHRANILDTKYTHIGVGYVASGNYWTQQFIQK